MINTDLFANFTEFNQRKQLAHAYLFNTVDAELTFQSVMQIVQSLLCNDDQRESQVSACGQCKSCQLFVAGSHPDLRAIDSSEESIGVDEIRALSTWLQHKAQLQKGQFAVINHADNMTESAANALLKTLEEPSKNSYLLLINDSGRGLMPTITSRCQVINIDA